MLWSWVLAGPDLLETGQLVRTQPLAGMPWLQKVEPAEAGPRAMIVVALLAWPQPQGELGILFIPEATVPQAILIAPVPGEEGPEAAGQEEMPLEQLPVAVPHRGEALAE